MGATPNYKGKGVFARDVLDHGFVALRNLAGPTRRPATRSTRTTWALRRLPVCPSTRWTASVLTLTTCA